MTFSIPTDWTIERLQEDSGLKLDFLAITIPPTAGRPTRSIIEPMSITTTPTQLVGAIKNHGGTLPADVKASEIAKAIIAAIPNEAGVLARTTGWKAQGDGLAHILPIGKVGDLGVNIVLDPRLEQDSLAVKSAASLESWQKEVSARAAHSGHASLAIMASLASCMRHFSVLPESFILNFFGKGSAGKTSGILAAASVWGSPDDISKWDGTPTGLVHMAAANSDAGFVLDDAERAEIEPKDRLDKVRKMIHVFAAGETKTVARSMRDHLPDLTFRVIPLSTSPKSIRQDAFERDKPFTAGDLARLLEVGVPDGDVGGIWASITGDPTPTNTALLSQELFMATKRNFGVAGPALLKYLVEHRLEIPGLIARYSATLVLPVETNDPDVKGRIADKVRFLYASARIARNAGVLDWKKSWIETVARFAYQSIVDSGFPDDHEAMGMLRQLEQLTHNKTQLPRCDTRVSAFDLPTDAIGFVSMADNRLFVRLEPLMARLAHQQDKPVLPGPRSAFFSALQRSGALLPGEGTGPTRTIRLASGKPKLLEFDVQKLGGLMQKHGIISTKVSK